MHKHSLSLKDISVFSLMMLITISIDSIRNLPATALFGTHLFFFFGLATLIFLLPTACISAELSASFQEGGIYHWVYRALGQHWAFLAVWLQWANTVVWYPTILFFLAGTLSFLFSPKLAQNTLYLCLVTLCIFWGLTGIAAKGLRFSARFASISGLLGMVLPVALLIIFSVVWWSNGHPLALNWHTENMVPSLSQATNWVPLTAMITAFLGMELATVHVRGIDKAQKKFPKALFGAVGVILLTMVLGALSIALVVPAAHIHLVDGVMQTFQVFLQAYHQTWLIPVLALSLFIGSLGGMINWLISPIQGLLQAAEKGYLPAFLSKKNKQAVPHVLLFIQAGLVTLVCLSLLFFKRINATYWLLTDLSTELYLCMYLLLFCSAFILKKRNSQALSVGFVIPGGIWGHRAVCFLGIIGVLIALVVGFLSPSQESINISHYTQYFLTLLLAFLAPVLLLFLFHRIKNKS